MIVSKGRRSMTVLQDRVRKCEGFERTDGREEMYANLIAFPMRA